MSKDFTKYDWNNNGRSGQKLPKNQLVWSIVNDYIKSNQITHYAQLLTAFPNSIRAKKNGKPGYANPMYVPLTQALTYSKYTGRFYDSHDKIFHLQDGNGNYTDYVVNKEWGIPLDGQYDCWQEFLDTAKKFGYVITINNASLQTPTKFQTTVSNICVNTNSSYKYPVIREGNVKNPKLVILLCNPGGDSMNEKSHPEYQMHQHGLYKDSGMNLSDLRKYCTWWENLLSKIETSKLTDKDILCLEYYPYPSPNGSSIPQFSKWDSYAKKANAENIELIKQFIKQGVIIYGFYTSAGWYKMPKIKQMLQNYPKYYTNSKGWLPPKLKHLAQILRDNGL